MAAVLYPPALATVATVSPGPIPTLRREISSASVPFATETQCGTPQYAAKSDSNAAHSRPRMYQPLARTRFTAAASSL